MKSRIPSTLSGIAGLLLVATSVGAFQAAPNQILYWKFEEAAGNVNADSSGNALDGTWQTTALVSMTAADYSPNTPNNTRSIVFAKPATMPRLILNDPPSSPISDSLADIVNALDAGRGQLETAGVDILDRLTIIDDSTSRRPSIRRGRPASFLLLAPAEQGDIDPETARVESVFIDGVELTGASR